jgi:hypothetical protein
LDGFDVGFDAGEALGAEGQRGGRASGEQQRAGDEELKRSGRWGLRKSGTSEVGSGTSHRRGSKETRMASNDETVKQLTFGMNLAG